MKIDNFEPRYLKDIVKNLKRRVKVYKNINSTWYKIKNFFKLI